MAQAVRPGKPGGRRGQAANQPSLAGSPAMREWYITRGLAMSHGQARCISARLSQTTASPAAQ